MKGEKLMLLLIGIDHSPKKHDICIIGEDGRQLARGEIPNSLPGFQWIHEQCQRLGVSPQNCLVASESAHNLVVDFLLDLGYRVHEVPGRAVDRSPALRKRSAAPGTAIATAKVARPATREMPWYWLTFCVRIVIYTRPCRPISL
jgi:hypothetical protein